MTSLVHCTDRECPAVDDVCEPGGGAAVTKGKCDVRGTCGKANKCYCTITVNCL